MDKKLLRNDFILIIAILVLAILFIFIRKSTQTGGAYVVVNLNNDIYGKYSLSEDNTIDICIDGKLLNRLVIADGYAYMSYASCPDGLCMKQQKIKYNGESLCCLPNGIYVEVNSDEDAVYDAITQ